MFSNSGVGNNSSSSPVRDNYASNRNNPAASPNVRVGDIGMGVELGV